MVDPDVFIDGLDPPENFPNKTNRKNNKIDSLFSIRDWC
jgi:hypothetical protein